MDMLASGSPLAANGFASLPFLDPARPPLRFDPAKAWRHFRKLVEDKENTAEVFPIFEALPWRGAFAAARRFIASPEGRRISETEPYLPALLDDHEALRRTPAGSVAHAYCDFMEREGLTAQGLVDEYARFSNGRREFNDQMNWYFERMRDTHDLQHVLTGYGRDALGEQCVLAFTYGQQPSLGHLLLGYAGGVEIKRRIRTSAPLLRAVREAQKAGAACPRLIERSVLDLLPLPLEEARRRLNIRPARLYAQVHTMWRARGIDPYDLLSAAQAKAA